MIKRFVIPGRFPSLNDYVSAERSRRGYAASMKKRETKRTATAAHGLPTFVNPVIVAFK